MISNITTGKNFAGLVYYLTEPDKMDWVEVRNHFSENPMEAAAYMQYTASQNERVQKPVWHLSVNWDRADNPTREQMVEAVDRLLKELGQEQHQAVYVAHKDREHPHVHVALNIVHPVTEKAWDRKSELFRIQTALRRIEKDYGWRVVPGRFEKETPGYGKDFEGENYRVGDLKQKERIGAFAAGMGIDGLDLRHPKERAYELKEQLFKARSFKEFDAVLLQKGLWIEPKGQGAVITDGQQAVKASSISREFSKGRLEARFGESLKSYTDKRELKIDPKAGWKLIEQWAEHQKQVELSQAGEIISIQKARAEAELARLQTYEKERQSIMKRIYQEFKQGFAEGEAAYQAAGRWISGRGRGGIAQLKETLLSDPERFGPVTDPGAMVRIVEHFRTLDGLNSRYAAFITDMSGEDRRAHIKRLERKGKRWGRNLESVYGQMRNDIRESEAGRDLDNSRYHALHISRALNQMIKNPNEGTKQLIKNTVHDLAGAGKSEAGQSLSMSIGQVREYATALSMLGSKPGAGSIKMVKAIIRSGARIAKEASRGQGLSR